MRQIYLLTLSSLLLVSCASWRASESNSELTLDDEPQQIETSTSSRRQAPTVKSGKPGKPSKAAAIVVEQSDIDLGNRMAKAMDSFVFKNQEAEFKKLCTDSRFDCSVDGARFPAKRRAIKRTVPPFLSGSKMGFKAERRVQVRYEFYP